MSPDDPVTVEAGSLRCLGGVGGGMILNTPLSLLQELALPEGVLQIPSPMLGSLRTVSQGQS